MNIIYMVLGVVVILVAISVIAVSLRGNVQGEEDDPLQERLAEFIQRGNVTSSGRDRTFPAIYPARYHSDHTAYWRIFCSIYTSKSNTGYSSKDGIGWQPLAH